MQSVHACAVQTDILHLILTPFFERKKDQKIETVVDLRGGTCDTSKIRGELGSIREAIWGIWTSGIWEASGKPGIWDLWASGIWEASWRHLGSIREAIWGIWTSGIWEASGKHLGGIWEASTSVFPPLPET